MAPQELSVFYKPSLFTRIGAGLTSFLRLKYRYLPAGAKNSYDKLFSDDGYNEFSQGLRQYEYLDPNNRETIILDYKIYGTDGKLVTEDVDQAFFKNKKVRIHCQGNGEYTLENKFVDKEGKRINDPDEIVIVFNYRGVGKDNNKFKTSEDLYNDGLAMYQYVIGQSVEDKNIIISGHSLGGGVANAVAAKLHEKDHKVYLQNWNSFSSMSAAAVAIVQRIPVVKLIPFVSSIVKFVTKLCGCEMNAFENFNKVGNEYKRCFYTDQDGVIASEASLYQAVQSKEGVTTDTDNNIKNIKDGNHVIASQLCVTDGVRENILNEILNEQIRKDFIRYFLPTLEEGKLTLRAEYKKEGNDSPSEDYLNLNYCWKIANHQYKKSLKPTTEPIIKFDKNLDDSQKIEYIKNLLKEDGFMNKLEAFVTKANEEIFKKILEHKNVKKNVKAWKEEESRNLTTHNLPSFVGTWPAGAARINNITNDTSSQPSVAFGPQVEQEIKNGLSMVSDSPTSTDQPHHVNRLENSQHNHSSKQLKQS